MTSGVPSSGPGGPIGPSGSAATSGKNDRPLWKKKRFIIPAAVVAVIVIASIAGSGGNGSDGKDPVATDTNSTTAEPKSEDSKKSESESKPKSDDAAEDTADDKPEVDDGTQPSLNFPKQNGDWRLDQLQLKDDGLGDFGAVGRITYTGEDKDGGDNIFTVTVFSKDGNTILATLTGSANSVKPGQTVTTQFISSDKYKSGKFPSTFQNDL